MKRNDRKAALLERQSKNFNIEADSSFSDPESEFRRLAESRTRSSEYRFALLSTVDAVSTISKATKDFESQEGLRVTVAKRLEDLNDISINDYCYQYSPTFEGGSLGECSNRIKNGEDLIVVLVWEEDILVGYGIAALENIECEIEVIDVDTFSTRKAGLSYTIQISNEVFQVGVGHVVVKAFLEECPRPIKVDATKSSSRYIFMSLGFIHDKKSGNPCFLKIS